MTKLLEKVFDEVSKLPQKEQDALAAWIMEELASEQRWEKTFTKSSDLLNKLADEALTEHQRGKTQTLDPNNL